MDTLTKEIIKDLKKEKSQETKELIKAFLEKPKNPYKSKIQYLKRVGKITVTQEGKYTIFKFIDLEHKYFKNLQHYIRLDGWNIQDSFTYKYNLQMEFWFSGTIRYRKYGQ